MIPEYIKDQILELDLLSVMEDEGIEFKRGSAGNYVCCCPFHNEKTPSFSVSTSKNLYYCFGCHKGGNAITFIMEYKGMSYPEALEYLAGRNGIHYEKRELTAEERERIFRKEQLINVNKAAQRFFVSMIGTPAAQDYVNKRGWNEDVVQAFGVGYAPGRNSLLDFLRKEGWKEQQILAAGLAGKNEEDGSLYDFFSQRVIFPVYSRTGYIEGFTGRYIGDRKDLPKYKNSRETEIFKKGDSLFGYFQAQRKIATTETVILCEGNPDVVRLHQIGQDYAVAPMGTALTDRQVELLRLRAKKVIIIGDTDAAGVKAVEEHGLRLLKAGLSVRVMELPEDKCKDADEYFLAHRLEFDECLARRTSDYIPWLCERRMLGKVSQTEQAAAIVEMSGILAACQDQNAVQMYLDGFIKEYKNGSIWKQEYYKAKNARDREQAKDDTTDRMLSEYGFYIKDNCYFGAGSNSKDKRWSNFVLEPILHIRDEKNARRIFRIRNFKGQEAVIKLNQSELVSFSDFKTRTETAGNYVWEASQNELTNLKKYLYDDTPSADEIKQLGWQRKWRFYAWGNGGLDDGTFVQANDFGIIDIRGQKFYLPGCSLDTRDNPQGYQQHRKFLYARTSDISLREFSEKLILVFGDNAKVALCFLVATLFKDIVTGVTTSFPILNLFGPKGTGKSELGHSLTSFFIPNNIAPNINNTTKAALAEAVAEVSNAVVHLDEYKNNLDLEKREFLKGLWDGAGRSRMNMDNDKKRETTAVDCGVVMSGQEMPTADIALFNRLIFLTFSKSEFSDQEKRNYEMLKIIEKRGLTHLTGEILQLRSLFQGRFRENWDEVLSDLNEKVRSYAVEDRTLRNWATVLAAFRTIEGSLNFPFGYKDMLPIVAKGCVEQNNKTKANNELSGFWETVDILVASSKIWLKVDYHIKYGRRKVAIRESSIPLELNPGKKYLYISFSRISQLYAKESKDSNGKMIPRETLKYYLEHSPEFLGTVRSERFRLIESPNGYIPSDPSTWQSKVTTAMLFDYDAIRENYNIDIDVQAGYKEEDEGTGPDDSKPGSIFKEIESDEGRLL